MLRQPFKCKTKTIECIIPQNSVRIAEPPSSCRCTTAVTSSAITTRSNACHHARASVCSHKQRVCIAFKCYPPEPHSLCLRKESATSADNVASSPLQSASGRDGTARLRLKPSQWWLRQREGRFLQVFGGGFCAVSAGVGRVGQTIGGCVCV